MSKLIKIKRRKLGKFFKLEIGKSQVKLIAITDQRK